MNPDIPPFISLAGEAEPGAVTGDSRDSSVTSLEALEVVSGQTGSSHQF